MTAASASTFRNNDGIVIYGAGAAPIVNAAPAAPRVAPGISETETVPDAPMTPLSTGKATYSYRIVARDIHGGSRRQAFPLLGSGGAVQAASVHRGAELAGGVEGMTDAVPMRLASEIARLVGSLPTRLMRYGYKVNTYHVSIRAAAR